MYGSPRAASAMAAGLALTPARLMIALGFEDVLIDAGFQIAGVVGKLEKAMAFGVNDRGIADAALNQHG